MKHDAAHAPYVSGPSRGSPVEVRDAGLALVRRVKRRMIFGAVLLAGGVSAVTAHAFHARTAVLTRPAAPAAVPSVSASQSSDDSSGGSLQSPSGTPAAAPPASAPAPAPVVSGGS
jgi:hypothetical protein